MRMEWLYILIGVTIAGVFVTNVVLNLNWIQPFGYELEESLKERTLSDAQRKADRVESEFLSIIDRIERVSEDVARIGIDNPLCERLLQSTLDENIRDISILDEEGREEKRFSKIHTGIGRDFGLLEEFERGRENTHITGVRFTEYGEPYLLVYTPARNVPTQEPQAILRFRLNLSGVWDEVVVGEEGERIGIVDDAGILVANTDPSKVLERTSLIGIPPAPEVIEGREFEGEEYINKEERRVVGVGAPIPALGWGVIVERDAEEIKGMPGLIESFVNIFLFSGMVVILLLVLLGVVIRAGSKKIFQREKELREKAEELEEMKEVLEIKVKARTKELKELNNELEEEVKRRTKKLRDKVRDLEKFRRITVGRELKMVELKKQLRKTREELQELKKEKEGGAEED